MKLPSLIPDSNLLEQIEGVEAGLRKVQKIGRVGQYGFLITAILQIVFGFINSEVIGAPAPDSGIARVITAVRIISLLALPLFILLFTWSKFWLKQSREPFRYTCSIEEITALPHSPKLRQSAWLANDLEGLLSQRVDRIRFVKQDPKSSSDSIGDSHIEIGGTYVVRPRDDEDKTLVLEIMPNVGIGRGNARKLSYPVSYPPDPTPLNKLTPDAGGEIDLKYPEYKALLERVYSSVATEIYQQIQMDVAGKIELMPTRFLRALALFHEAEDYARSNTLHGYAEAAQLYDLSARLFDRCLAPLPVSPLRRFFARLTRRVVSLTRGAMVRCAPLHLGFARREIMSARALTGYVNMLLYGRLIASISGQKINSAYEAQRAAQDALQRFKWIPLDSQGCRKALFDAHVSLALAYHHLGKQEEAENELSTARSKDPTNDRDIRFQMVRSVLAPRDKQAFRHLLSLAPRWETAQWSVASEAERQWRARPSFETSLAELPLREYKNVIDLNPGNVGAWANRGYLLWLIGKTDEAKGSFRAGRDYKQIKQETLVTELDYGLARIAAEEGEFKLAYVYQDTAVSELIAPSSQFGDFRSYYFAFIGDAILKRFEQYRRDVEKHLADPAKTKDLPTRILNSVYSFVLTDYGECCQSYYQRTADFNYWSKSEQAFELANLFDPENPLALYNLRQLKVGDVRTPGHKNEAELQKEVAAAQAQIAALQKEQATTAGQPYTDSTANETEKTAAPARNARIDALQLEIDRKSQRIREWKTEIDNARQQTIDAKQYDQKIRELHPYWTVGMQCEAEMNALEAFIARRDAFRERTAVDGDATSALTAEQRSRPFIDNAISLEKKAKQNIRAILPHEWLWTDASDFNWDAIQQADPLNERRWEKQFNDIHTAALATYAFTLLIGTPDDKKVMALWDHIAQVFAFDDMRALRRLRDLTRAGYLTTYSAYDRRMRMISERWLSGDPNAFAQLWWISENPFTDSERMKKFLNVAERRDLNGSLYEWLGKEQLLGIAQRTRHKRELLEPVAKQLKALSRLENVRDMLAPELAREFGNGKADGPLVWALKILSEIYFEEFHGNGIDKDELERLEENVGTILTNLQATLNSVRADARSWPLFADRSAWEQLLPTRDIELDELLAHYREIETECDKGARQALPKAVKVSSDPVLLWNIGTELAILGLLEPALDAVTRAAQCDSKRPEASTDDRDPRQLVETLLAADPAHYSGLFGEFLKVSRQPQLRVRPAMDYLRRQCALLVLLERFAARDNRFVELKKSNKFWRTAITAETADLVVVDEVERYKLDDWPPTRPAVRKWLSAEQRSNAHLPDAVLDCRIAQITLTRDERRAVRERVPVVPGAISLGFPPIVKPLVLEFGGNLLRGPSRRLNKLWSQVRKRVRQDTGVRLPIIAWRANDIDMLPGHYVIMINEIPLDHGTASADKVFVQLAAGQSLNSLEQTYPAHKFKFPPEGDWMEPERARLTGRDSWDPLEYITGHIEYICRVHLVKFFDVQATHDMLAEWLKADLPTDLADYIRTIQENYFLLVSTSRQLRGLLDDRVPLTQPKRVAAGLRDSHHINDAVERRRVLRDSLRQQLWGNDGEYAYFRLPDPITAILDTRSSEEERVAISPDDLERLFNTVRRELQSNGTHRAIVTRGERLRHLVRHLIRAEWNDVPVLADYELLKPGGYENLPTTSLE